MFNNFYFLSLFQRKHVNHLKKYEELTSKKRKRTETLPTTSTFRQTTLVNTKTVSQMSIDRAILTYVVQGLQPIHVVEKQPFQDFVKELQPNARIMSRPTLCSMIDDASMEMKKVATEATVEDACSLQLLRPNATRWNSLFLAVERLLRIIIKSNIIIIIIKRKGRECLKSHLHQPKGSNVSKNYVLYFVLLYHN